MITNRKRVLGFIFISMGVVVCCFGVWAFLKPPQYQAAARIKITTGDDMDVTSDETKEYADLIRTEFAVLRSDVILSKAADVLDLKSGWRKKYAAGNPLKPDEVLRILGHRMSLRPVQNTRLIDVCFRSKDPKEAAIVADAIAVAYRSYRFTQCRKLMIRGIRAMEEQCDTEEQKYKTLEEEVEQMKRELKIPESETNDLGLAEHRQYWEARKQLETIRRRFLILTLKIDSNWKDPEIAKLPVVFLIERASPPLSPIRTSRLPLVFGLAMIGLGLPLSVRTQRSG